MPDPSPTYRPESYLASSSFSSRLTCPRTNLKVSYCDIGDPVGIPLLWMMPSGCSRWFIAPQDPVARMYGVRIIGVDRPGVGGTDMVPLHERIEKSCEMMLSVLEKLDVKPAHVLATSAGMYHAFHMLIHHPEVFLTGLTPPPRIYFVAPWSPILPSNHADYYPSKLSWIPSPLISTQHITLPHLSRFGRSALDLWDMSLKTFSSSVGYAKTLLPAGMGLTIQVDQEGVPEVHRAKVIENGWKEAEDEAEDDEDEGSSAWWGGGPDFISRVVTEYVEHENYEGIGQEHLLCLNRGPNNTGSEWLENAVASLAGSLRLCQGSGSSPDWADRTAKGIMFPLDLQIWWGWQDGMVPRKGQIWFNKAVSARPDEIEVTIHDVPDGDHGDLIGRVDGIHKVYRAIQAQGHSTRRDEAEPLLAE